MEKKKSVLIPESLHIELSKHKQELLEAGQAVTLWEIIQNGLDCLKKNNARKGK